MDWKGFRETIEKHSSSMRSVYEDLGIVYNDESLLEIFNVAMMAQLEEVLAKKDSVEKECQSLIVENFHMKKMLQSRYNDDLMHDVPSTVISKVKHLS